MVGLVVDEDHGEPAVLLAQQPGLPVHRQPGPARRCALARRQVELDVVASGQRLLRGLPGLVVELPVAHQAQLLGPVVEVDDVAMGVHHDGAQRHQRDDALQHL